jgi:hypothetical protein
MKTLLTIPTVVIQSAIVTSTLWAQAHLGQTQQGTRPGAPGNNASQPATASGGNFNGINQSPWFGNQATRQQLELNDTQFKQLNRNYGTAWDRYNEGINALDPNLTPQARQQRQMELSNQFRKDFNSGINDVFTDPAARQRFNGLDWQYRGYDAFNDPTVQQRLNLTAVQRQQFNQYGSDWNQQYGNWRSQYSQNQQDVNRQFTASQAQMQDRIKSTLTPDQQRQWSQMSGEPFNFTPDVYFGTQSTTTTAKPVIPQ